MRLIYEFEARGHSNITSTHKTTLMTTVESNITTQGDCIVAVGADVGLLQLPEEIKKAAKDPATSITFLLSSDSHIFETKGSGHSNLTYFSPIEMVVRKSTFTCGRTIMINSDKSARDIPKELIRVLQSNNKKVKIRLVYETDY
jgi:hypothetical protein